MHIGATGDNNAELRQDHIQPLGDILANAMQATAAVVDQTIRLDHFFHMGKMLRKGTAIGRAGLAALFPTEASASSSAWIAAITVSRSSRPDRIGQNRSFLGLASQGRLLEGLDQLLQPLNTLILAGNLDVLPTSRACAAISIAFRAATSSGRSAASSMERS